MAKIQLEDVTKRYPDGFEAVKHMDLDIADGEFMILVGPSGCGKSTALRMIAGLEDITEGQLYIGEEIVNDRQLVLTCRSKEYRQAVNAVGVPLAKTAVIEIEPMTRAQAAMYLPLGQIDGRRRWAPVISHMKAHPTGALALTLSTPLMVYLARTAYTTGDPATLTRFTDRATVELHLLTQYMRTVYGGQLPLPADTPAPRQGGYTIEQAWKWLRFLAHVAPDRNALSWWNLSSALRWPFPAIMCALLAGAVGALLLPGPISHPGETQFAGLGLGLIAALLTGMGARRWIPPGDSGLIRGVAGGLAGGIAAMFVATAMTACA